MKTSTILCPFILSMSTICLAEYFICGGVHFDDLFIDQTESLNHQKTNFDFDKAPGGFTPILEVIDPLGAVGDVEWYIHVNTLNVRSLPSTTGEILGNLTNGDRIAGDYYVIQETDEEWFLFEFEPGVMAWTSRLGFSRVHPFNEENLIEISNLPIGEEIVNRWWGIPSDYEANDLEPVPLSYTDNRPNAMLRKEARDAAIAMIDAARLEGVEILVGSNYRSFDTQQSIYVSRMNNDLSQRSSAPPGHSEHQLGVTVDWAEEDGTTMNNQDSEYFWMVENAADFGWRQTYTADNIDETGYIEEPWHWRYVGFETTDIDAWVIYE